MFSALIFFSVPLSRSPKTHRHTPHTDTQTHRHTQTIQPILALCSHHSFLPLLPLVENDRTMAVIAYQQIVQARFVVVVLSRAKESTLFSIDP